jgi:queuine tRNA-ribosyltransferase
VAGRHFEIVHEASNSAARAGVLHTQHGSVVTPCLGVPAAGGAVVGLTPRELRDAGVELVVASSYELMVRPGVDWVQAHDGVHRLLGWRGPVLLDGAWSPPPRTRLQGQSARVSKLNDDGFTITSYVDGATMRVTPEGFIAAQEALGADVMLTLAPPLEARHDADRTAAWARRCVAARTRADVALYCQGWYPSLRVDGVSLSETDVDLGRLPPVWPRLLDGRGGPRELLTAVERGFDMITCTEPLDLAVRGQCYEPTGVLDLNDDRRARDPAPIDEACECYTCRAGFSRGALKHLFACDELLAPTLVAIHNLRVMHQLAHTLRVAIQADSLADVRDEISARGSAGRG